MTDKKNSEGEIESESDNGKKPANKERLPILHILTSVFSAAIGVQSKKNQEKDFNGKGSIYIYIAAGVIFTVLFVITVVTVVKMVLSNAGM